MRNSLVLTDMVFIGNKMRPVKVNPTAFVPDVMSAHRSNEKLSEMDEEKVNTCPPANLVRTS